MISDEFLLPKHSNIAVHCTHMFFFNENSYFYLIVNTHINMGIELAHIQKCWRSGV